MPHKITLPSMEAVAYNNDMQISFVAIYRTDIKQTRDFGYLYCFWTVVTCKFTLNLFHFFCKFDIITFSPINKSIGSVTEHTLCITFVSLYILPKFGKRAYIVLDENCKSYI